jgi:glycosyltransferase involved in cell wall biosynthesis
VVLGVDVSRLVGPRTGVGRAIEYLLRAWATQELAFERIELYSPAPIHDVPDDGRFRLNVLPSRGPGIWWEAVRLRPHADAIDLLFAPTSLPPAFRGRAVVESHGLLTGPNLPPAWHLRSRARGWHAAHSARAATAVVAVSHVVKDDLARWCGVQPERITVIPLGMSDRFRPARPGEEEALHEAAERVLGSGDPFLLFVGKLSTRRHVPELIEAFARLATTHPELHLLVVGPAAPRVDVAELADRAGRGRYVHHLEHLDHETLALLYRGARALVLPSTREAWSVPIAEALASGCPVVAVDGPWLEGIREAILTVPAPEVPLLTDALDRVTSDDELVRERREVGLGCAEGFPTHEERARRVAALLADVARQEPKTEPPDGVSNPSGSTQMP